MIRKIHVVKEDLSHEVQSRSFVSSGKVFEKRQTIAMFKARSSLAPWLGGSPWMHKKTMRYMVHVNSLSHCKKKQKELCSYLLCETESTTSLSHKYTLQQWANDLFVLVQSINRNVCFVYRRGYGWLNRMKTDLIWDTWLGTATQCMYLRLYQPWILFQAWIYL